MELSEDIPANKPLLVTAYSRARTATLDSSRCLPAQEPPLPDRNPFVPTLRSCRLKLDNQDAQRAG